MLMPGSQPPLRHSLVFFLLALAAPAFAQSATQPPKPPVFDTASIRQNVDPKTHFRMQFTEDGVSAEGVTLQYALEEAYGLYDPQRWSGGPDWLNQRRFNIEARFDPAEYKDLAIEQRRAMLQHLLADRCKLVVHHETKEIPVYALVVAKNGPKFQETKKDNLQPHSIYGTSCLNTGGSRPYHLEMKSCTMLDFASALTGNARSDLNRNVIDHTGLSGHYDIVLNWSPEDPATAGRFHSDALPIFSALPEQLGLKLDPTKGKLDKIVIDHIEMPSEN
jgi:uncharacterized protein (TIGR03435 family)